MDFNKTAGIYDKLQDLVNDTQTDMTKLTLQERELGKRCRRLRA